MPKCIELLPWDWLISNLCYQAIEQMYLIKWPVSIYFITCVWCGCVWCVVVCVCGGVCVVCVCVCGVCVVVCVKQRCF